MSNQANDPDTETTEELVEGTREAKAEAEQSLAEAHDDAEELQETLEAEGLVPPVGDEEKS